MEDFKDKMFTLLTFSSPHVGCLIPTRSLENAWKICQDSFYLLKALHGLHFPELVGCREL